MSGKVHIEVKIEKGMVVNTKLLRASVQGPGMEKVGANAKDSKLLPYLVVPSLANVKTWQFTQEVSLTFVAEYIYRIRGSATEEPETPKVLMDLPRVEVTAKPFKPTCSDCTSR